MKTKVNIEDAASRIIDDNSPIDYGWLDYCHKRSTWKGPERTASPKQIFTNTAKEEGYSNQIAGRIGAEIARTLGYF
jgi:hypothetical protein